LGRPAAKVFAGTLQPTWQGASPAPDSGTLNFFPRCALYEIHNATELMDLSRLLLIAHLLVDLLWVIDDGFDPRP
jgi:hypothetical protein